MKIIEVPVFSFDTATIAQSAGADRLELCSGFHEGGTTPSHASVTMAKKYISIPVNIMIRPRGGDFLYSNKEFELMIKDAEFIRDVGLNGIVFGILNTDGTVDKQRCMELIKIARPLSVTFHRAFDRANDPFQALEDIIEIGFDRILTSGQQKDAHAGSELIANLVKRSNGRIIIMPGCGINSGNLHEIIKISKANEFHASAKKMFPSNMKYHNDISMGKGFNYENSIISTDVDEIKKLKNILNES